jgi:hypothetical protein
MSWFIEHKAAQAAPVSHTHVLGGSLGRLLAIVDPVRLRQILATMLDEGEFLSPHGLRALSARHRDHPYTLQLGGEDHTVDYEPGESTTPLFGGNSNWRGPVWFPLNHLLVDALRRFHGYLGPEFTVEHPTGSGRTCTLEQVADDLSARLVALFLPDARGWRPVYGPYARFVEDPAWREMIPFHEYFHGDTGAGLGASHQTGWTGLVADLLLAQRSRGPRQSPST